MSQAKDVADQDSRKPFTKRGTKTSDAPDFPSGADAQPLDPISEEDEKLDHSISSKTQGSRVKGAGPRYHNLPSDEDSGPEEADNTTPLLHKENGAGARSTLRASQSSGLLAKPGFLAEILLDKKDSSDSGMRSGDSSSDRSLEEAEEAVKPSMIELELESLVKKRGLLPSSLSGLQDATVARMSICSEAPSEASLMASSPDEGWPSSGVSNLNRTPSDTILNNNTNSTNNATTNTNTNNSQQQQQAIRADPESTSSTLTVPLPIIITPGSGTTDTTTTAATIHHNQNLRTISLGDERESIL